MCTTAPNRKLTQVSKNKNSNYYLVDQPVALFCLTETRFFAQMSETPEPSYSAMFPVQNSL